MLCDDPAGAYSMKVLWREGMLHQASKVIKIHEEEIRNAKIPTHKSSIGAIIPHINDKIRPSGIICIPKPGTIVLPTTNDVTGGLFDCFE